MPKFTIISSLTALLVSSTLLFAEGNGIFTFDANKTESALLEQLVVERKQFLEKPQRTIAIKYAQTLHNYVSAAEDAEVEPVLKELETVFESYPDNQVIKAYKVSIGCMSRVIHGLFCRNYPGSTVVSRLSTRRYGTAVTIQG